MLLICYGPRSIMSSCVDSAVEKPRGSCCSMYHELLVVRSDAQHSTQVYLFIAGDYPRKKPARIITGIEELIRHYLHHNRDSTRWRIL